MASLAENGIACIVAGRRCDGGHNWAEIGAACGGRSRDTVRVHYYKWKRAGKPAVEPVPCPVCGAGEAFSGEEGEWRAEDFQASSSWEEAGNYADLVVVTGRRVRSFDDLVAAFDVDLDQWAKVQFKAGTWEGFAKREDKDLVFTSGVIDGHAKSRGVIVVPLYRTEARFVRREPVPLRPVVQPVACPVVYQAPAPAPAGDGVQRGLLYADQHFGYARDVRLGKLTPFHDRRALDLVIQVAAYVQPAVIVLLGDFLDNALWTDKFIRSPEFYFTTQPAVVEGHLHLRRLREACPNSRIVMLPGNHDQRIKTALTKHLLETCELRPADELHLPPALHPARLLALHELGIEWLGEYPAGAVWLGPLRCRHGRKARAAIGATAKAMAQGQDVDEAAGHIHRIELLARRVQTREGWRTVRTWCLPCTCHLDGRVPGSSIEQDWQQGLGLVDFTAEHWTPTVAEFVDGRAVVGGRLFVGRDDVAALREAAPDWNW